MRTETLPELLDHVAAQYGERPALIYRPDKRTKVWSYNRLRADANRFAVWLQRQGVEKGDRVVLWAPNSPWWVVAYFGILRLGAIVVPLDLQSSPALVRGVEGQTEPKLAIVSADTSARWTVPTRMFPIEELDGVLPNAAEASFPTLDPGDIAEIVYTSGTTGTPKGVMLTHRNIRTNVEGCNQIFPSGPRLRPLSILPLSHMFEQTVGLLLPLRGGTRVVYSANLQPATLFRDMRENEITTMLVVPRVLKLFKEAIEREAEKGGRARTFRRLLRVAAYMPRWGRRILFRSVHRRFGGHLDFFVVGGAPVDPDVERWWELLGVAILPGYGLTETSPVITSSYIKDRKPGSVGRPIPGVEVMIAQDGEVLARGLNVMAGYWHNSEETEAGFENGWYRTGDLGRLEGDGRLYLHGRKKDLIVLSDGRKVHPEDVEDALRRVEGVVDAVVVGLPSANGPHVHAVLLVDRPDRDLPTIVQAANRDLAPQQRIKSQSLWPDEDFPRTRIGKVKRFAVLEALTSRAPVEIG